MDVTLLLYPGVTALDAIGPYEVLSRPPGWTVRFAALERGEHRTDRGTLGLVADHRLADVERTDLLLVPGGPLPRVPSDEATLSHVRRLDATTRITASVCTGAFVLARAGLLTGKRATTHWSRMDRLRELGVDGVEERTVRDGKYATAAGVSAGIDLGLRLVAELASPEAAQLVQLGIEYDPLPPFDSGHPSRASAAIVARYRAAMSG
jgi:transcriptional regulator GlxA family with amidase domain